MPSCFAAALFMYRRKGCVVPFRSVVLQVSCATQQLAIGEASKRMAIATATVFCAVCFLSLPPWHRQMLHVLSDMNFDCKDINE